MQTNTVARHIANFVSNNLKVDTLFSVTGGGAMFLNDAFGNHENLKVIYNHHEQASAMAAVGYAKAREDYGVACVTTGCGCTNAITGLLDAWQDNVSVVFISGQVKLRDTTCGTGIKVRQIGVQEANIIEIVKSITKYAVMLEDPKKVRYELEKASWLSQNGRPGPVWIDVPQDIQGAPVNWDELESFSPDQDIINGTHGEIDFGVLQELISRAERPIVIAGNGLRLANQRAEFRSFVERLSLPVTFSYLSIDLLPSEHPLAIGRLGTKGDRAGNFAVQNADLVIVLGCRLSVPLTGFEYDKFARKAKVVVVDIDEVEHKKGTVRIDHFIHADLRNFFNTERLYKSVNTHAWLSICQSWKSKWPVYQERYSSDELINMYEFIDALKESAPSSTHVISDAGSAYYVTSQALQVKEGQRYHTSGAQADMGFTLPAAIGVAAASPDGLVVGITGDGSFQMNLQELQVLKHHGFNLKLVIWNNAGYLSIKTTQRKFFSDRFAGTGRSSGLSFPDSEKIANAYGIRFHRFSDSKKLRQQLASILEAPGPCIIEVICPEYQEVIPNVSALKREDGSMVSKPIEDMYPYLDRDEFYKEMIVPPIDD